MRVSTEEEMMAGQWKGGGYDREESERDVETKIEK